MKYIVLAIFYLVKLVLVLLMATIEITWDLNFSEFIDVKEMWQLVKEDWKSDCERFKFLTTIDRALNKK